uniref:Isopropylmalate dehydrogenase-like domain-containing protein n=1 Tax=Timema shepardi TaxID=629360 RepID=A0A7R9B322_TIMSH|nr:unnamed protein product [Timema shepardi]
MEVTGRRPRGKTVGGLWGGEDSKEDARNGGDRQEAQRKTGGGLWGGEDSKEDARNGGDRQEAQRKTENNETAVTPDKHRNRAPGYTEEMNQAPVSRPEGRTTCTLIPGDGVGPELVYSVQEVFKAAGIPVDFEPFFFSEVNPTLSAPLEDVAGSITRNGICLKGILSTPDYSHTGELQTLNMKLRNELDLYANVVHVKSLPGIKCRHQNVDAIIIREQTEGEYSALEHECVPGVVECLKIVTRQKSKRIAKFAFDYATKNNRKKVTAVHKANIMKLGDGLFLKSCQETDIPETRVDRRSRDSGGQTFPRLGWTDVPETRVDRRSRDPGGQTFPRPGWTDVPETWGARHTFSEAVGKNVANPTAMLLCGAKMLNHVNLQYYGDMIRNAINRVLKAGKLANALVLSSTAEDGEIEVRISVKTKDLGGQSTTNEFTYAVIHNMR